MRVINCCAIYYAVHSRTGTPLAKCEGEDEIRNYDDPTTRSQPVSPIRKEQDNGTDDVEASLPHPDAG